MIPKLFSSAETEFTSYGIGSLPDAISCKVEEERNGIYEMTLTYPITGRHYENIQYHSLILVKPNPYDDEQAFRVYRISKPLKGKVTVYAQHISYDMGGIGLSPFSATSVTEALTALKVYSVDENPFTFSTDKGTQATMTLLTPSTVRTVLGGVQGSILDTYGGEWKFDQYSAYLYNERGKNRGVTIRYGKNLTDLKQEENCSKICTAIYPYWTDGTNVVTLPEKTVAVKGGPFDFTRTSPLDFSQRFENQPTEEQLRNAVTTYINSHSLGVPEVSLDVSFEVLSKMTEYSELALLEHIELCDMVTIHFEKLGVETVAKVISYEYDALNEKYTKISLGDRRASIADTVVKQQLSLENEPTRIYRAVENATAWITGSNGGYVIFTRNEDGTPKELLVMDTPSIETATKVWRWNQGGLGYSSTGYNGPYTTAITQDGAIVADFMSTGVLTAVLIQSEDGKSKWDLSTGAMELYNTKISTSAVGRTYTNTDYGQSDLTRLNNILIGVTEATLIDYEKLDINGDGKFGPTDTVQINQIIQGLKTVNFTTSWQLSMDPMDGDNLLKIYRVYKNNLTGKETENLVFSAGFSNVKVNSIETGNVTATGEIKADSGDFKSLRVNGQTVEPFEQAIIGYVVFCAGQSGSKASCFIPYGMSGTFQCASNDWYCTFSFNGYGSATKTAGSSSTYVDSTVTVYNTGGEP